MNDLEPAEDPKIAGQPDDQPESTMPEHDDELPEGVTYDTRDPVEMLDSIASYIRQHLVCDDHQLTILALWIVHTWSFQEFPTVAYLHISSPEPQSGKTRCLDLLNQLADWPEFISGASPATITGKLLNERTMKDIEVEKGVFFYPPPYCFILDDCHHTFAKSERQPLVAMLNSGCRKSSRYLLGTFEYGLFGPKAFAGNTPLPQSLASRSIPIVLRRKKPSEPVARFDPAAPPSATLTDLLDWLQVISDNPQWIAEFSNQTPPNLPSGLTAHQQDCAEPLLHIANAIAGPWPERARAAIAAIFEQVESTQSLQVLEDIRACFHSSNNPEYLSTRDLLDVLLTHENRPWSGWVRNSGRRLGALLQPFGISSQYIKVEIDKGLRGYRFRDFQDAWDRYLPPLAPLLYPVATESGSEVETVGNVSATLQIAQSVASDLLNSQTVTGKETEATD